MSRLDTGGMITVKPTNNVYTALAGAGAVIVILGIVMLMMRASELQIDLFAK